MMMSKPADRFRAFRADERPFNPGDNIPPPGDHIATLAGDHLEAERLVRQYEAKWQDWRANHLYAFRDLDWARKYWAFRGPRYFYEISIDRADILHIGDMEVFNQIPDACTPELKSEWVRRYCAGEESPTKKKIELIVRRALLVRTIHTPDDQPAAKDALVAKYRVDRPR
jgi:hypothetical protein